MVMRSKYFLSPPLVFLDVKLVKFPLIKVLRSCIILLTLKFLSKLVLFLIGVLGQAGPVASGGLEVWYPVSGKYFSEMLPNSPDFVFQLKDWCHAIRSVFCGSILYNSLSRHEQVIIMRHYTYLFTT